MQGDQTSSITKMIEQILERGEVALIVTKVSGPGTIGAKLLVRDAARHSEVSAIRSWTAVSQTMLHVFLLHAMRHA